MIYSSYSVAAITGDAQRTSSNINGTESAVIGNAIVHVYKARVSQQPGMDGSYKSASTFAFTLSALDAKRADGAAYDIAYVKKDGGYIK